MFEETYDLSPKMQGLVASSIKCAALELVEILPEEPPFKENTMNKILTTIARAFSSQPCPLEGIKPIQSEIRAAYDSRIGYSRLESSIYAGHKTRSSAIISHAPKVRSIR